MKGNAKDFVVVFCFLLMIGGCGTVGETGSSKWSSNKRGCGYLGTSELGGWAICFERIFYGSLRLLKGSEGEISTVKRSSISVDLGGKISTLF